MLGNAVQVASLFGVLDLEDRMTPTLEEGRGSLQRFESRFETAGRAITRIGGVMAGAGGLVAGAFALTRDSAVAFDESLANIQAVTMNTSDEMALLRDQLLAVGSDSRFGAQQTADAFYDIVGGVADATTHMDILTQAIATAQAGNTDLGSSTSALISIMNSYGFAADQASFASDVLTRTVGVGVGTMGEFAGAFPVVTGLASQLGIGLDEVGGSMAFLTTQGFSASQSATQLRAMMVALLNPNQRMRDSLREAGLASGQAAIEQYGLVGAYQALVDQSPTFRNEMAGAVGSVEALTGVMALGTEDAAAALQEFNDGLQGLTDATAAIQMESAAAQQDLFNSSLERLRIEIGSALLPAMNQLLDVVRPVVTQIADWARENPQLVAAIAGLAAGAAALGAVLIPVGLAFGAIGTVLGVILSPIGLVVGAIAALGIAFATNFGGIRDFVEREVFPRLQSFFDWLGGVWNDTVRPGLEGLYNWFVTDGLPAIRDFVTFTVEPAIQSLIDVIAGAWAVVQPGLEMLRQWFVDTALPAVVGFVRDNVIPVVRAVIDLLKNIWNWASPGLNQLAAGMHAIFNWIVTNVINPVVNAIGSVINAAAESIRLLERIGILQRQTVQAPNIINPFGGLRDSGGPGYPGQAYVINPTAGPEVFIPSTPGTFIPNADRLLAGGETTVNISLNVTEGDAYRAGVNFAGGLRDRMRANG